MIVGQEIEEHDGEVRLFTHFNTDETEKENWRKVQEGKGFIRDKHGNVIGREIARIPMEEAAMLKAQYDLDYLSFSENGDRAAFRRLLKRFPHWRCAEGRI